jgi:hypothetical protein
MEIEVPLFQGLSLKIGDTHANGKEYPTALLQKGFILLYHDQELAEEAVGFGVPVLKRGLQTIFPGAVTLTWLQSGSSWHINAQYNLNLIEKFSSGRGKYIENRLFYNVKDFLAGVIRHIPLFRGLLTATSSNLRRMLNWETTYAYAGLSTEVKVIYTVEGEMGKVTVEIDTSGLPSDITEVVIMNEQGAHSFNRYQDSSGVSIQGDEIGCWDEVNAEEAWFESSTHKIAFKLGQVKGARLFRGRELIFSRLAWAGFGYSFPSFINRLRYEIRIERLV